MVLSTTNESSDTEDVSDEGRHHARRGDFGHLSELEWLAVQRMAETVGDAAVGAMLLSLGKDEQHGTIAKLIQHELDQAMEKLSYLEEHNTQQSDLLREQGAQQADLLRQQGSQQSEL